MCFWCLCVLATIVTGVAVFSAVAMTRQSDPATDTVTAAAPPSSAPTSAPPTYTPSSGPTSAPPTSVPSIRSNGTTSLSFASPPESSWSPPPLVITLCVLAGAAVLAVCSCTAWRHYRSRAALAAAVWHQPPRVSAPDGKTDLQAEIRQVASIRARHAAWRLEDVAEEDIDMSDMPAVSAIHYNLSPSETLEGEYFNEAARNNDKDEDDATLVLDQHE